jgi:hypothetical protein
MTQFATYRDSFPNARLTRSKTGVLEVAYKGELTIARRLLNTRCPIDQMNNARENEKYVALWRKTAFVAPAPPRSPHSYFVRRTLLRDILVEIYDRGY